MTTPDTAPIDSPPKRRKSGCFCSWMFLGCLGLFALFLFAAPFLWIFCIYAPPLIISKETTRITGPLTADGQIEFFKALEERTYPPEFATDDNGYRIFVRQFGDLWDGKPSANNRSPEKQEFYRLQKYEKLDLDPNFQPTLGGKKREVPTSLKLLDGKQEAELIALRLSDPPEGRNGWTLRLLAERIVELEIAPKCSRMTVQRTLKKTASRHAKRNTG